MVKKYLLALSVFAVTFFAYSDNVDEETNSLIVSAAEVGTFAGSCDTLSRLFKFQQYAKIEGGDYFIEKFIESEMNMRSSNIKEFLESCNKSIDAVNALKNPKK